MSVGGWTHGTGGFSLAAKTSSSRQTFAQNALSFINTHKFDGIDIDWEYPGYEGTAGGSPGDVQNYLPFLKVLKQVFSAAGKEVTAAMGAYGDVRTLKLDPSAT